MPKLLQKRFTDGPTLNKEYVLLIRIYKIKKLTQMRKSFQFCIKHSKLCRAQPQISLRIFQVKYILIPI